MLRPRTSSSLLLVLVAALGPTIASCARTETVRAATKVRHGEGLFGSWQLELGEAPGEAFQRWTFEEYGTFRTTQQLAGAEPVSDQGEWEVLTRDGDALSVRITLGDGLEAFQEFDLSLGSEDPPASFTVGPDGPEPMRFERRQDAAETDQP